MAAQPPPVTVGMYQFCMEASYTSQGNAIILYIIVISRVTCQQLNHETVRQRQVHRQHSKMKHENPQSEQNKVMSAMITCLTESILFHQNTD